MKTKKMLIGVLIAVVVISVVNVLHSRHKVNSILAQIRLGMTETEVLDVCGPPTQSGQIGYPEPQGSFAEYSFPYWWDYVIWKLMKRQSLTNQGKPYIPCAPKCTVEFKPQNGQADLPPLT